MTLLLVWYETLKSVFVIVFTVFDVIMTWLIDRLDSFLYYHNFERPQLGNFEEQPKVKRQLKNWTLQSNEDPRRLLTDLELGTRSALLEVEACSMFRSRFTKKNSGIRAHLIEVIKHRKKTKNWACIMWILLTCHFPRDIKGLHNAFTRYRTPLTWLEIKLFKT